MEWSFKNEKAWEIIFNPNALGHRRIDVEDTLRSQLAKLSVVFHFQHAHSAASCRDLLRKYCEAGKRHFMIVGGDGTLNESINGIVESGVNTQEVFVVVIPVGTGNDWSRTHHYPTAIIDDIAQLQQGRFTPHDIGVVETLSGNEIIAKRHFINIAGFGFDAAVIETVSQQKSTLFPSLVYLLGLLKTLFNYRSLPLTVSSSELTVTDRFFSIAVGICQYNGNGMRQVPSASPQDGLFDVVLIRHLSKLKVIRNVQKLFSGKHIHLKEVTQFQTTQLTLHSTEKLLGEVEGELLLPGKFRIKQLPHPIQILTFNANLE